MVNARLIHDHWDDLLRLAGSLKLGKVKATAIMRTLQRAGSLSGLGRAVAELGRVEKILYLLAYVQDEAHRRRILVQLNRGEGRHAVARAIFHGKKGELRYREGMEDQFPRTRHQRPGAVEHALLAARPGTVAANGRRNGPG